VRLAQVNVTRLRYPVDDPRMAEFASAVDELNALAERTPGFVWRHPDGHVGGAELLGDPLIIVNLSVWVDYPALHGYAYRGRHGHFVTRRALWSVPLTGPHTALWWVPDDRRPTPEQAVARLTHLRRYGPTPKAFTVRVRFGPAGEPVQPRFVSRASRAQGGRRMLGE
jgi:hypothetical protein